MRITAYRGMVSKNTFPLFLGLFLGSLLSIITFPLFRFTLDGTCNFSSLVLERIPPRDSVQSGAAAKHRSAGATRSQSTPEENYEPVLVKKVIKPSYIKNRHRPRFAATELGIREKLLIAVITTRNTALSLAVALNRTTNHYVSKMLFFIDREATDLFNSHHPSLNIIGVPSVSPETDSLFALDYIARHFANVYDWFMVIPDHTYVPAFKAFHVVSSLSVSEHAVVGRPLKDNVNVCSYDSGILLSHGVLQRVAPRLQSCVAMMQGSSPQTDSYHLGHCIWHATQMKCEPQLNGQKFMSWELPPNLDMANTLPWLAKQEDFEKSISIFKVTSSADIYRLHKHFCESEISQIHEKMEQIRNEMVRHAAMANQTLSKPIGFSPPWRTVNRYELLHWDFFTESELFESSNVRNVRPLAGIHAKDINDLMETCVVRMANDNPDLRFKRLLSGYRKFDPTRGMDYILDLVFDSPDGSEAYKRFLLLRPLNKVEIVPVPYVTEATMLWLILPVVLGEVAPAKQFLADYKKLFSSVDDNSRMTVLLLLEDGQDADQYLTLVHAIEDLQLYQGPEPVVTFHYVKYVLHSPLIMMDFLMQSNNDFQLCVMLSPWVVLSPEFLNRARMNAVQNFQVFFPIPFVRYHPAVLSSLGGIKSKDNVNKEAGHFDNLDFTIAAFYRSDYVRHRNRAADTVSENNSFKPEAVYSRFDLVDLFVNSDLHIMRAIDPLLIVEHHDRLCDRSWDKHLYDRCEMSRKESLGSKDQLAKVLLSNKLNV